MPFIESPALSAQSGRPANACLDLSDFPIVQMTGIRSTGHAFAWCAAMRKLLARAEPFVYLDMDTGAKECEEDRRARRCWSAANTIALSQWCRGYIVIEGNIARRGDARSTALALLANPSPRVMVVSNVAVARQLAVVLLKAEARVNTTNTQFRPTGGERRRRI